MFNGEKFDYSMKTGGLSGDPSGLQPHLNNAQRMAPIADAGVALFKENESCRSHMAMNAMA